MAFNPRNGRGDSPLAEINVTPFVDVVLVLLIIFMLTAHVMEYGVDVDVPKTKEVSETTKELAVINISAKGDLYLNDQPTSLAEIVKKVGKNKAAYLRCDRSVPFEVPANVMAELARAQVRVNVVTQPLEASPRRRR